ncbi:MAG: hypothetical protein J5J00_09075 [Deltaproteobacteria bacterium]|nr:hypothetical protein [Deltaproteobacteria bacterium]
MNKLGTFLITGLLVVTLSTKVSAQNLSTDKKEWISTAASNSLEKAKGLFKFGRVISTKSEETNIHAHYKAKPFQALKNYTYSGQFRIANADGGIGVTFHSKYPSEDQYYRLRSFPGDPSFKIAPHPDGIQNITEGDIDTEVAPSPGKWYNFKVMVRTTKKSTRIRAKVWRINGKEPGWQIDCSDSSDIRIKTGKLGLWSLGSGKKEWRNLAIAR